MPFFCLCPACSKSCSNVLSNKYDMQVSRIIRLDSINGSECFQQATADGSWTIHTCPRFALDFGPCDPRSGRSFFFHILFQQCAVYLLRTLPYVMKLVPVLFHDLDEIATRGFGLINCTHHGSPAVHFRHVLEGMQGWGRGSGSGDLLSIRNTHRESS